MRASAREIAKHLLDFTTQDVYEMLSDMGFVIKDKGTWLLTELGKANGGKMSRSNYPTPTFDIDSIIDKMIEFGNKTINNK